jgi:uncharacterized protein YjbJ (UPF0337 family)
MNADDIKRKAKHKAEEAAGAAQRMLGEMTGDTSTRAKGTLRETEAKAKLAADEAARRAREAAEELRERASRNPDHRR